MEAEREKKVARAAEEEAKMVEEQGEKEVVASEAEEAKMVEEPGEKGVVASEAEEGKMVEGQGEKAVVASSEAEKGKTVAEQGEKAVAVAASSEAEKGKMVEGQGEKAVAASETEIGAAEAKDVTGGRLITLESSDGEVHRVSEAVAQLSGLLRCMVQDGITDIDVIPLLNVDGSTLAMVLEYCNKHAEAATKPNSDPTAGSTSAGVSATASEDLEAWDREFLDRLTMDALYDLLVASTYLNIHGLLDAVAHKAADMIKGKTTDEIRDAFNIVNDLTPEQEAEAAELSRKYVWDFYA